ncbi:MFS transporter [Hoeflea prorocentri]|uniref:MFS transporter n=1 Tax=Hoeflea prorocentri TaxID=1922333 RepID=A0A9X3UM66_9HYPH|nr:MFS transporter [Hoeflea prorocentri]MCY6383395.1 MFS transporter [Hoeflea prorocentri]MDA5401195.1 MFS transporter [Hoeflea prorocentri]
MSAEKQAGPVGGHTVLGIATLMITAFTIGTDFTGALLLVPSIESELAADITTTQWVLNIYALSFAMFMVTGGRLGDTHDRRRVLLIGLGLFIIASVGCLLAPDIGFLIAARAVQGLGAALIWLSTIALGATNATEDQRGLVMGLILAGVTSGNVIGPLIGGVASDLGDWRLFFLVNAVLGSIAALLVFRLISRQPPQAENEQIDYSGILILSSAILALLFVLDVGTDWGWGSLSVIGILCLSLLLFLVFPFVESRVADPLLPPQLLRNRAFMLILWLNALMVPSFFVAFLYVPQFMQRVLGWSVLTASFGMIPLMLPLAVGSIVAGNFYKPYSTKRLLFAGYVLIALGCASVILLPSSWGYYAILPAMLLISFGAPLAVGTSGTATVSAVAASRAGLAGGLSFMLHLAYGAIGVAVATAIMYGSGLMRIQGALREAGISISSADISILNAGSAKAAAAGEVLARYSAGEADRIRSIISQSFAAGMSLAYWPVLLSTVLGLFLVALIDESKLHAIDN